MEVDVRSHTWRHGWACGGITRHTRRLLSVIAAVGALCVIGVEPVAATEYTECEQPEHFQWRCMLEGQYPDYDWPCPAQSAAPAINVNFGVCDVTSLGDEGVDIESASAIPLHWTDSSHAEITVCVGTRIHVYAYSKDYDSGYDEYGQSPCDLPGGSVCYATYPDTPSCPGCCCVGYLWDKVLPGWSNSGTAGVPIPVGPGEPFDCNHRYKAVQADASFDVIYMASDYAWYAGGDDDDVTITLTVYVVCPEGKVRLDDDKICPGESTYARYYPASDSNDADAGCNCRQKWDLIWEAWNAAGTQRLDPIYVQFDQFDQYGESPCHRRVTAQGGYSGEVEIRVYVGNCPPDSARLTVGCSGGNCGAGTVGANVDSMAVRFNLGPCDEERSSGAIWLRADEPSAGLSSAQALEYFVEERRATDPNVKNQIRVVLRPEGDDQEGALYQVATPRSVAVVIDDETPDDVCYVWFYARSDMRWSTANQEYEPINNAAPFVTWSIREYQNGGTTWVTVAKYEGQDVLASYIYTATDGTRDWSLQTGDGTTALQSESVAWTQNGLYECTRVAQQYLAGAWHEVSHIVTRHETQDGPWVEQIVDPTGANLVTTRAYYDESEPVCPGCLQWQENPDGSWVWYVYDYEQTDPNDVCTIEWTVEEISGFKDTERPSTQPSLLAAGYQGTQRIYDARYRIKSVKRFVDGVQVGQSLYTNAYTQSIPGDLCSGNILSVTEYRYATSGQWLFTTTIYDGSAEEKIVLVQQADRHKEYHSDNGSEVEVRYEGETGPVVDATTRQTTHRDASRRPDWFKREAYTASGYQVIEWLKWDYDTQGRRTFEYRVDPANESQVITQTQTEYINCCYDRRVTDAEGIETTYLHDVLGRPTSVTRDGLDNASGGPEYDQVTGYTYGFVAGVGPSVRTTHTGTVSGVASEKRYDLAGRLVWEATVLDSINWQPALVTSHAETILANGHRQVTVTRPDGSTEITEYYRDGQIASVTGTGVVTKAYDYGVDPNDATPWTQVTEGPTGGQRVTRTTVDWLGRTVAETRPAWPSGELTTAYAYYPVNVFGAGQLKKTWTEDPNGAKVRAPELHEYNALGNLVRSGLDLDENDALVLTGSNDRYTETTVTYSNTSGLHRITTTQIATEAGLVTTGTTQERLTSFPADTIRDVLSYDVHGNATHRLTTVTPATRTVTETIDHPDSTTDELRITINGLLMEQQSKTGVQQTYTYDPSTREAKVIRPGVAPYENTLIRTHYDSVGQIDWTEDALGSHTTYEYYGNGVAGAGKVSTIATPTDDPNDATYVHTYYEYDPTTPGQPVLHVWGDVPQPAAYSYDAFGRLETLTTFRSGTGFENSSWPSPTGGDVTTWVIDQPTGLLLQKRDDAQQQVAYSYTVDGRVKTRTWARLTTSSYMYYGENGEPKTGELKQITYDDGTPSVQFTYNRSGTPATIVDAAGTHTFDYNSALQFASETIDGTLYLDPLTITQQYQSSGAVLGRYAGVSVTQDATSIYSAGYTYDPLGRLSRVTGPGLPTAGSTSQLHGAVYRYRAGTDIVERIDIQAAIVTDPNNPDIYHAEKRVARLYPHETQRDLVDYVQNIWYPDNDPNDISKYDYVNGDVALRRGVSYSGVAFGSPATPIAQSFDYNNRNELTTSVRSGTTWGYLYDPIGNRTWSRTWDDPNDPNGSYVTNELNQYTQTRVRSTPQQFYTYEYDDDGNLLRRWLAADMNCDGVVGFSDNNAFVLALSNPTAWYATYPGCNILNGDINGDGVTSMADINPFVALMSAGNVGVTQTYTWDGENRLTCVEPTPGTTIAEGAQRLSFRYDYLGRRLWKQVEAYQSGNWVVTDTRKFIWDSWRMLAELRVIGEQDVREWTYTWGLDLAGQAGQVNSLEGAGTIGGLLAAHYLPGSAGNDDLSLAVCYDGNGNVTQLVNWKHPAIDVAGALIAKYEYDPYGNITAATGDYAAANPFRFSTKYWDDETGLGYWGYRYYNPALGRWISRDPVAELGFAVTRALQRTQNPHLSVTEYGDEGNLFSYIDDEPMGHYDPLGLSKGGKCNITPSFVTGRETVEELESLAKAARAEGKIKKAKSIEGYVKVLKRYAHKGRTMGRKSAISVEGLCCMALTEILFLEVDLGLTNILNDAYAADLIAYNGGIQLAEQSGWQYAIRVESQIGFTCCGKPFSDDRCRVTFRRKIASMYGRLYVTGFNENVVGNFPGQLEEAAARYVECNTKSCQSGATASGATP